MSKKPKPTKPELAVLKVMSELGHTTKAISRATGKDPKTIKKYLQSDVYLDPDLQHIIAEIKGREIEQLTLIDAKARTILNNYLDECLAGDREPNPISVTAILDRTFTQRRLLEDKSTSILGLAEVHKIISEIKVNDIDSEGFVKE